jgi:hypothetical protein
MSKMTYAGLKKPRRERTGALTFLGNFKNKKQKRIFKTYATLIANYSPKKCSYLRLKVYFDATFFSSVIKIPRLLRGVFE